MRRPFEPAQQIGKVEPSTPAPQLVTGGLGNGAWLLARAVRSMKTAFVLATISGA